MWKLVNDWTRKFHTGSVAEYGNMHFFTEENLRMHFRDFEVLEITEMLRKPATPKEIISSDWIVVDKKP